MTEEQLIRDLLQEAKIYIEHDTTNISIDNGNKFEAYVVSALNELKKQTKYKDIYIKQTGAQSFPDIIIGSGYGIEVKYTQSDKWSSTGNSIFEGTAVKEVDKQIYLLFGMRQANKINIRIKNYEDCLEEIKVTHSPRFTINMNMEPEDAIFSKLAISYNEFKSLKPLEKTNILKEYVKETLQPGEALWWVDNPDASMTPKVKIFNNLSTHMKEQLIIEGLIYCPDIFSNFSTKYANLSVHYLANHNVINSSLRDTFTAGGKKKICLEGKIYSVSSLVAKLEKYYPVIKEYLKSESIDLQRLHNSWSNYYETVPEIEKPKNRLKVWKNLVYYYSSTNDETDIKIIEKIINY